MNSVIVLFPQKKVDVRLLQDIEYRTYSPGALGMANQFRKIFQGRNPLYRLNILQQTRSREELTVLLIKQGGVRNVQQAIEFIRNTLGRKISYTEDGRYFVLRKKIGKDEYSLRFRRN